MLAATVLAGGVLAGCGGASTSAISAPASSGTTPSQGSPRTPRILDGSFHSDAVQGTLHYSIALPPGYGTSGERYPVIYVLHGLPSTDQAYKGITGYADGLASTAQRAGGGDPLNPRHVADVEDQLFRHAVVFVKVEPHEDRAVTLRDGCTAHQGQQNGFGVIRHKAISEG